MSSFTELLAAVFVTGSVLGESVAALDGEEDNGGSYKGIINDKINYDVTVIISHTAKKKPLKVNRFLNSISRRSI